MGSEMCIRDRGGASQWVHVPWGNCASPSTPSHEEGVALLVARTCNAVVPAYKEFLRARQTPVPLICIVCWVLTCAVPGTRYAAPGTRCSRLEYVQRVLVSYILYYYCCCCTYIVVAHIPISPLNFEGVTCRILFTSSANTPKTWWEGNLLFFSGRRANFLETYFRKHYWLEYCSPKKTYG